MTVESFSRYFEPVRKTIEVGCAPEQAFDVFSARFASWWPLATHSIGQEQALTCGIEPRVGGEVYEVNRDGTRCKWGQVLVWDPPRRLTLYWHPGMEERVGQEVEVTFTPTAIGTRVDLEHRNWAQLGDAAGPSRDGYNQGWETVFVKLFAQACHAIQETR